MVKPTFTLRHLVVAMMLTPAFSYADPVMNCKELTFYAKQKKASPYLPQKITVASKSAVSIQEIPQSIAVVSQEQIKDQHLNTVDDALKQVTGITVIPNDLAQSAYKSRGYALNTSVDGIASYNGLGGNQQFDMSIYDRVEVQKGAAGLFQGTDDLGGTVNLVTKKPTAKPQTITTLSLGSWNNWRGEFDTSGALNNDESLKARLVTTVQDRDFFTDNTHHKKGLVYGVLTYDLDDHNRLSFAHTTQRTRTQANYAGLPAFKTGELLDVDRATNPTPDWANDVRLAHDNVLTFEHFHLNGWKTSLKARYFTENTDNLDTFAWSGVEPTDGSLTYAKDRKSNYRYKRKAFDLYTEGPFEWLGQQHRAVVGYNYEDYQYKALTGRGASLHEHISLFNPNQIARPELTYSSGTQDQTIQSGMYGQLRFKIQKPLTFIVGGRLTDYKNKSRDIAPSTPSAWTLDAQEKSEFTPYLGIVYDLTQNVSVYSSYSNIFVPQTKKTADNQTLKPRQGNQFEAGIKANFLNQRLNTSLAVFQLNDQHRALRDDRYPDDYYYLEAGQVRSRGIEAEVIGQLRPHWNVIVGYTYFTNKYINDAQYQGLPFSTAEPKSSLKLWNMYEFATGDLKGLKIGTGLSAVSHYYGSRGTQLDRKQGGYALLNAMVSYPLNTHTTLALNAENLTDRKYYASTGGINSYNTYGTPRNFTLSVSFKH